jgi:hypothetical protein
LGGFEPNSRYLEEYKPLDSVTEEIRLITILQTSEDARNSASGCSQRLNQEDLIHLNPRTFDGLSIDQFRDHAAPSLDWVTEDSQESLEDAAHTTLERNVGQQLK